MPLSRGILCIFIIKIDELYKNEILHNLINHRAVSSSVVQLLTPMVTFTIDSLLLGKTTFSFMINTVFLYVEYLYLLFIMI